MSNERSQSYRVIEWESAKYIAQKGVRAIDARNSQLENDSNAAKKTVFALPGSQRMSVNTLLCDTLGPAAKTASFCRKMTGREVTRSQISIPIFHGTL